MEDEKEIPQEEPPFTPYSEREPRALMEILSRQTGRRTKCTPEVTAEIAYSITIGGLTHNDAATLAGINRGTFYNWMKWGRDENERTEGERDGVMESKLPYFDFFNVINKAQPLRKMALMEQIAQAGKRSWQALAWLLERQYPEEFARKNKPEEDNWRPEVISLIKQGVEFDVIAESIGEEETRALFISAGEEVPEVGESK